MGKKIKTVTKILSIVIILASVCVLVIMSHFNGISSGDQQDMCLENQGTWDYVHETCDNIDLISCTLMNGTYDSCKSPEYRCALDTPTCTYNSDCIETCLFEQSVKAKVMTDDGAILENFFSSTSGAINCNIWGRADGECFVKAYEECQPAIIKQSSNTVEGDPIFFYAQIMPDSCSIQFIVDDRYDKYGSHKAITERTCRDAQLLENSLSFLCGDDVHGYGFSLR